MLKQVLLTSTLLAMLSGPAFAQADKPASPAAPSGMQGSGASSAPAATDTGTAPKPPAGTTAGAGGAAPSFIAEQQSGQVRADEIIGATVKNPEDENIGKIEDLILDKDSKVVGAVVSVGGFLGIGSKEVAVPWEGLQVRSSESGEADEVVVTWTKEQLEAAPDFKSLDDKKSEQDRASRATAPAGGGMGGAGGTTGAPAR